jgi:glycosyltransferase involved in cell wall biosynthesis
MPKTTVIMLLYNGEEYVREAIDSIISQTFTDFELLVIDDGSTDNGPEIVRQYADNRIRLIVKQHNEGIVAARNTGLKYANGEYIAWLDCDDIASPTRLEEQVTFLDEHPDFGAVGSWYEEIDENGKLTGKIQRIDAPSELIPSILLFRNYFGNSSIVLRRSVIPEQGCRLYPGAEDFDLMVRISQKAKLVNLPKILMKYRVHGRNITVRSTDIVNGYVKCIVRSQLERMQISIADQHLEVHQKIAESTADNAQFMTKAESWLTFLRSKNCMYGIYERRYFDLCIGNMWLRLLLLAKNERLAIAASFMSSGLALLSIRYLFFILLYKLHYRLRRNFNGSST